MRINEELHGFLDSFLLIFSSSISVAFPFVGVPFLRLSFHTSIPGFDIRLVSYQNSQVNCSQISSQTLLGKLIRLPFKLLPRGAVVRILRGPARGRRWISDSSTRGFWLGYWELENQRLFAQHLHPGDVVYDIGAHVGLYTILSSVRVQNTGHVYAFEPLPRNLHFLRRHAGLNCLSNCTIIEAAVSDSSGTRRFDPTEHDSAGHFSLSGSLTVSAISLDEFLVSAPGIRPPTAMKVNAEGAEMEVLSGGRRVIGTYFPLIFLSTHSPEIHQKCTNLLESMGYAVREVSGDKLWAAKSDRRESLDSCPAAEGV